MSLGGAAGARVLAGFAISVCAPVVEEIFFRGVLYRALRNRLNVPMAAVVADAVFAAAHALAYPLDTLPPRLVFGIVACLLYARTGSLLPGIALHCIVDAGGFEAAISRHDYVFAGSAGLGAVLLGCAGIRRWSVPNALTGPDRSTPGIEGGGRRERPQIVFSPMLFANLSPRLLGTDDLPAPAPAGRRSRSPGRGPAAGRPQRCP